MEEAPGNSKESSHSAHGNGMNEYGAFKGNLILFGWRFAVFLLL